MKQFFWRREQTPAEVDAALMVLSDEFSIAPEHGGKELVFKEVNSPGTLKVTEQRSGVVIEYGSFNGAMRGIGIALAGMAADEKTVFSSLGIMLDCSRNAVMTVAHLKKWLCRLALMGYNQAMLYTEDTYELPDEPYFGYMRGPYTMAEMKETDAFAGKLGIEMIACIQTLGHLEQILQWWAYDGVRDTASVLMVDEPKTYTLIEKMINFWSEALASRRIHIGMDETHDLGRGRFMDRYGYERGFDIFNRHLTKVNGICANHGLKPMIWSDMYFRMGSRNGDYYDKDTVIPEDVKKKIPEAVDLVYWDYYHRDEEFYADWIRRHRDLGHEPLMGSGVWTWSRWWYDREITEATVKPCVDACLKAGLKEIFFTLWGDDGAYCEYDSCLAGLCWSADLCFGGTGDAGKMEKIFYAITGGSYRNYLSAAAMEPYRDTETVSLSNIIWDDPMLGKWYKEMEKMDCGLTLAVSGHVQKLSRQLESVRGDVAWADVNHAWLLTRFVQAKLQTMTALYGAYESRDMAALRMVKDRMIPETVGALREFTASFRKQWLRRNKPFGLETMQVRFGAMFARWEEVVLRLEEYLDGAIDTILELDLKLDSDRAMAGWGWYRKWPSGSIIV